MKVDGALKSLLQGVSQQPPRDRLAGQSTEQINMSSDPVAGLSRRAPTDLVGSLGVSSNVRGYFNFEAKNGQKFLLEFKDNSLEVVDYNTVVKTLTIEPTATAFLATPGDLGFGVVDNQVIITNKSIVPGYTAARKVYANKGTGKNPMAIFQVLGANYARTYTLFLNGVRAAMYKVASGAESRDTYSATTENIAYQLVESLRAPAGPDVVAPPNVDGGVASVASVKRGAYGAMVNPADWAITRVGDIVLIENLNGDVFEMTATDEQGGVALKVMTDNVPRQQDLPKWAPEGYMVRVASKLDPEDDLYLVFHVNPTTANPTWAVGTGFGNTGYWSETVSHTAEYELDTALMPHILEYRPDTNDFVFRRGNWKGRQVGTSSSNPDPSFIGNPIKDIASFQGRLVFLAGAYVVMSRTNRIEDFFMNSAAQLIDSDPIDISSTASEASNMLAVVPHNKNLVVFSSKGQFLVFGQSALTPANATLVLTTSFEAELNAKPVAAGKNVMFATNYGRFTGIREFFTEGTSDINNTRPVTQHVKEYIMGKATRLIASSNYDMLLVQAETTKSTVYVYQYVWNDNEKVQLAWHKWTLPYDSVYMFFDQALIYFVMKKGTQYFLYRMSLDLIDEPGVGYPVHLDTKFDVTGVNTQFTLPFNWLNDDPLIVVQGEGCPNPGMTVPVQTVEFDAGNNWWVVTLRYDMNGGHIIAGRKFTSLYRPTMPMVKDGDQVKIGTARLIIKKFIASLRRTGHIVGQLMSQYGNGEPVEFQARLLADPDNQVGVQPLSDEQFDIPFRDDADRADIVIYTDRHLPMTLLDLEWVGQYSKRGKRITTGGGQGGSTA